MKRFLVIILLLALPLCVVGCKNTSSPKKGESKADDVLNTKDNTKNKESSDKKLVVYFSKTGENYNVGNVEVGNTAMMASYIKDYLNADSFEIVPTNKYPDDYEECTKVATKEKNENARPKIQDKVSNFDSYEIIFIGYPVWWGDMPMIIYTFMEEYDFTGKTVVPFNTHEGSGDAGTYLSIKNKLKNANVNTNGLALQGKVARENSGKNKTIDWLKELGY